MKKNITKTLALIAALCGLQLFTATTAWAAGTPIVVWDHDFGTTQKTGTDGNTYTFDLNGNTLNSDGTIKITGSKGAKIDITAATARTTGTVIIKYRNLSKVSGGKAYLLSAYVHQTNKDFDDGISTTDANTLSIKGAFSTSSTLYGDARTLSEGTGYAQIAYKTGTSADSPLYTATIPPATLIGSGTGGTQKSLAFSNTPITGITLGGIRGTAQSGWVTTWPNVEIEAVAVFDGYLAVTHNDVKNYMFPSDPLYGYHYNGNGNAYTPSSFTTSSSGKFADGFLDQAMLINGSAGFGDGLSIGDNDFTVVFVAKSANTQNKIFFGLGSKSTAGFGFVSNGSSGLKFGNWSNKSIVFDQALNVASGQDATADYHTYVVKYVKSETKAYYSVDGSDYTQISTAMVWSNNANWQIGSIHGGVVGSYTAGNAGAMDELRIYKKCLSIDDVKAIVKEFSPSETYTATIPTGNVAFKDITWDGGKTWSSGNKVHAEITLQGDTTLTLDANYTGRKLAIKSAAGQKLTLNTTGNGFNLLDLSAAAGKVVLAGIDGLELAKNAVAGAPYSHWLGLAVTGESNLTMPSVPSGYTIALNTALGMGSRFVVTAPSTAKFGAVSLNISNGHALADGNHGAYPVDKASWGNMTSGTAPRETTVDGVTFSLSGKTDTFYQNGTDTKLLYDYVDDANKNYNEMTISGITYPKYRIIVYFNSDGSGSKFCPMYVNGVPYSAQYTDGTASTTVKDSSAYWGRNGNTAKNPIEGYNYIVSDVLTGSSATVKITSARTTARGTPAAYQVVRVGAVAKIGDNAYDTLAAAEAVVQSGETITLMLPTAESLTTAKTFTLDFNGFAYSGNLTVNNGGAVSLASVTSSSVSGAIAIAEGGLVNVTTTLGRTMHRSLVTRTTGDGTLQFNAGTGTTELRTYDDKTADTVNVNLNYLGTGTIRFVGESKSYDQTIISAGKTMTIENGTIWATRSEFVVNGGMEAKEIWIGHESKGTYPGKVTINATGTVKAGSVTFRNYGGSQNSVLTVGGVLEFTQNVTSAILLNPSSATYAVNINGGTLRAVDSSWYTDAAIPLTFAADTTTTLSAADGKTIDFKGAITGTGAIAVPGPGTVILGGTTHPATTPIVGTSAGTIGFVLTDEEKTTLEGGGSVSPFTFTGDAFAGKIKAFETSGTEYAITFTASEGTITVQKKADAKVPPYNLNATTSNQDYWENFGWKDSKTPMPQEVKAADWELKVGANIATAQNTDNKLYTYEQSVTLSALNITNAGSLVLSDYYAPGTITVDSIDDSASTGTTTIDFNTGSATITAGANTVLTGTGSGKITMAANKKVTVGNNHFGGDFTVTGGTQVYAPDATSEMIFALGEGNTQGILGNSDISNSRFAMTVTSGILDFKTSCNGSGYGVFNKRTMTADGSTAVLRLSADDVTGTKGGGVAINLTNGGALELANRDTMKLPVNLTGGAVKLLTGCAKGYRGLDLFGNNNWHAIGATGATAQNPTVSALTFEEGAADDDKKVLIRQDDWNITVDATAQFDVYATIIKNSVGAEGTPGKLVKKGAGRLTLKAANTYDKGTTLSAGTLTIENAAALGEGAIEMASGATLELNIAGDATFATVCSGDGRIRKVGTGTTTITGANTHEGGTTVEAGKLVVNGNFNGTYEIGTDGAAEFTVDTTADEYKKPTVTAVNGTLTIIAKTTTARAITGASFSIATLPTDVDPTKVTITLKDKDTGATIVSDTTINPTTGEVTVKLHTDNFTLTPTADTSFTWAVGDAGSTFDGGAKYTDFGNVDFKTTTFTNTVTIPSFIKSSNIKVGGTYNFSGSPVMANTVTTVADADATFANDVAATDVAVTNGTVQFAALAVDNKVTVTNATFGAAVVGPSMKYVRLTITETQGTEPGGAKSKPAVGEFRLYRGSATTGYTIVDWPKGTKVSDCTGLVATKETTDYPSEVGAGLGSQGGNECQPGDLIDGFYGNKSTPKCYGTGAYNTPAYNKWWPSASASPWTVTIEFPYPVATFSGCNFCLADYAGRNPTAWKIEVSSDGENWTKVNETTSATWSTQYAWGGGDENVPAFLNEVVTPTDVEVENGATVVADGKWTAALNVSGNITFMGVAGKNLTLDAASTSSFAEGAKLTFDLNAYDVSESGKQYVIAGPTDDWPAVTDITVVPATFKLYKDDLGYYVLVTSGNYWLGADDTGVGTWDVGTTEAWGTNITDTTRNVWLNGVPAFFTSNGEVTIDADAAIAPTAINVTSNNDIAVTFKGAVSKIAGVPFNIGSTNVTVTIENGEALAFGQTVTAVAGSNPKFVKKGTGDLTLNTAVFTDITAEAGTLKQGSDECFGADAMVTASGTGVLDLNGYRPRAIVTLGEGGALVNSGAELGTSREQCTNIVVTGNATIGGTGNFGLIAHSFGATSVELGANTLTKTGANSFWLCNTTITGAGTIQVNAGTLAVTDGSGKAKTTTFADGTISVGASGTLQVDSKKTLTLGKLKAVSGATITNSGTINGLSEIDGVSIASGTWNFADNAVTVKGTVTTADGKFGSAAVTVADDAKINLTLDASATEATITTGTLTFPTGKGVADCVLINGNPATTWKIKENGKIYDTSRQAYYAANVTDTPATWSTKTGLTRTSEDAWANGVKSTITLASNTADAELTFDVATTAAVLKVTGAQNLTLKKGDDVDVRIAAIDLTEATGTNTIDFVTGAANITAGANTIVRGGGTGKLTIGADTTTTITNGVWAGTVTRDNASTLRYAGTAGTTTVPYVNGDSNTGLVIYAADFGDLGEGGLQFANTLTRKFENGFVMTGGRFVLGNNASHTQNFTMDGGSITVTGDTAPTASTSSTLFAHYDSTVNFTMNGGTFTAESAAVRLGWDGKAYVTVAGGTFRTKGVKSGDERNNAASFTISGGTLELGDFGIQAKGDKAAYTFAGGTIRAYADASISVAHADGFKIAGPVTFEAAEGTVLKVASDNVAPGGSITVGGAGTVVLGNYRGAVSFAEGSTAKVGYTANINDLGSFTVPGDIDMSRVEIYNLGGQKLEIKSTKDRTVTFEWETEGAACWWDYGFNGNLVSVGSDTTEMNDEHWKGVTNIYNATQDALLVGQGTPWRNASFPDEFTAVIYGKIVDQEKSLEIGFGSTSTKGTGADNPYSVAFACGDPSQDEVIMLVTEGYAVKKTVSMRVPNAYDADHLYAFTCQTIVEDETEKTVVKLYLDGKLLQSYKFDTKVILGKGFQVGSVHGGSVQGGYEKAPKTNTHAELDFLRVFRTVMSQAAMTAYAEKYPYESANGKATRTFAGDTTWTLTDAWKQTLGETETQQAKPNANTMVEIKATADSVVTFDLSEAANYEQLDILTGSDITLKTGGTVKPSVVGISSIGTDVRVDYDAITFANVNILEGQSLTFDMTSIDLSKIYTTTVYELTGLVTLGDNAQILANYATNSVPAGRTVTFAPDPNNGHWKFTVTCEGPITGTVNKTGTWGADDVITWKMGESVIAEPDWSILNSATLVVGEGNDYTLTYPSTTVPSTIAKAGAGTLAITAGNDGKTYTVDAGTLKFATITNQGTATVTVNPNGTFDMNGQGSKKDPKITLTLAGGKLVNNGQDFAVNQVQFTSITLTADSTVGGTKNMYFTSANYAANTLQLGGHKLSKVDGNTFGLCNTTVKNGTLAVEAGTLDLAHNASTFNNDATLIVADAATLQTSITHGNPVAQTFGGDMSRWSSVTGSVVVAGGELRLGNNTSGHKGEYKFGKAITVNSGNTLYLHLWTTRDQNFNRNTKAILTTPVTLNGSRIYTQDGAYWFDSITVNGTDNTMQFNYNKSHGIGTLNGDENAALTLTRSSSESYLQYFAIDAGDFNGTLTVNNTDGSAAADFWLSPKGTVLADATVQCQGTGRPTYIVIRDDATLGEVTGDKFAGIFGDGVAAHTVTLTKGTYAAPIKDISTGTSGTYSISVVIDGNVTITGQSAYTGTTTINADAKLDAQLGAGLPRASTITIAEGGQLVVDLENFVTVAETSPAYTFSGDLPEGALDIKNQDKYPWISIGTSGTDLGKVIIDETKLPFTGLHIVKMLPKHTSKAADRDPNGRDSGWIDIVNYGPTETNLANFKIVRSNIGKKVKSDDKDLARLCDYTLPKGGTFRVYTSEEYETAEDFGGKGKEVAWFKTVGGVVTKLDAYEDGAIMVVPTKVNPKKFPMVRLYDYNTNTKGDVIDEIIVPCDMDDNMMLEVVANTNKLERRVVYPNGEKVECGPVVNSLYGVKDVLGDLDLMKPGKFAPAGQAYPVKIPVNPLMTNGKALDANTITGVNLIYRVFDPTAITVSNKVALTSRTIEAGDPDVAKYGEGCLLWEGEIPSTAMETAGKLVQFRAEITDKGGKTWIYPNNMNPDIGYGWYGVVVEPTIIETPGSDITSTSVCTNSLQTFLMFIDDTNKAEMDKDIDDPSLTLTYGARLAIYDVANHIYYDNVRIDLRGQTSKAFYKKSHGIRFNKVAPLVAKDPFTGEKYETRKTSFIAEYGDPTYLRQTLALRLMRDVGVKAPFDWPVRLYLNGTYYQLAFHSSRFSDEAVEDFYGLNKYGYAYKNVHQLTKNCGAEKKTPDDDNEADLSVLNAYAARIENESNPTTLTKIVMTNFNIAAWVNYMAATRVTQEADDVWTNLGIYINKYDSFFNANGDDMMMPLAYDQNLSWGQWYYADDTGRGRSGIVATNDYMKSHPFYGGSEILYHMYGGTTKANHNRGMKAILQNAQFREMLARRIRTLAEKYLGAQDATKEETPVWEWMVAYTNAISGDVTIDRTMWKYDEKVISTANNIWVWDTALSFEDGVEDLWTNYIVPRRKHLYDYHAAKNAGKGEGYPGAVGYATTASAGIPETQPATETFGKRGALYFTDSNGNRPGEANFNLNVEGGILGIVNTNEVAIDMSDWTVEGAVVATLKPGTVIPTNSVLWIVENRQAASKLLAEATDGTAKPVIVNLDKTLVDKDGKRTEYFDTKATDQLFLKDADGTPAITHEATIGTKYYITLLDAFNCAETNDIVALLTDIDNQSAAAVKTSVILYGDTNTLTGAGFNVADGQTLTIASGQIANGALGTEPTRIVLIGGKYTEAGKTAYASIVSNQYHFAHIGTAEGDYAYQVIPGAEAADDEIVLPVAQVDTSSVTNDTGVLAFSKEWLKEKGFAEQTEDFKDVGRNKTIAGKLNERQYNGIQAWENAVLGLEAETEEKKDNIPVILPKQASNDDKITFKLSNVDVKPGSGAIVTYKVWMGSTPGGKDKGSSDAVLYTEDTAMPLPKSGVQYYRMEIVTTPAK